MEARNVALGKDERMSLRKRFPPIEYGKQRIGLAECIDLDLTVRHAAKRATLRHVASLSCALTERAR